MSNWTRSNVSREQLLRLVEACQLPPLTATVEWKVPDDKSVPRPPKGFVVSFMAFHEHGLFVVVGRFIRGVLFEYDLQLQHLNPNNIQQMSAFEVMCKGYLGISAHLHLFWYFFMFACLKDGSRAATIGCANLRMKQGWSDDYIPSPVTSSNSGWHKGWFYCRMTSISRCRRSPGILSPNRGGTGDGPANSISHSRMTRRCWGVFEEPGSPCPPSSGSTTLEELCRSGGGHSESAR
jgi:hypothetical protein